MDDVFWLLKLPIGIGLWIGILLVLYAAFKLVREL